MMREKRLEFYKIQQYKERNSHQSLRLEEESPCQFSEQKLTIKDSQMSQKYMENRQSEEVKQAGWVWAWALFLIHVKLSFWSIMGSLLVCSFGRQNVLKYLSIPSLAIFFAILTHLLITQHSFIKISMRRGFIGFLVVYLLIVYQTALYWEGIFSMSIGDYPNYLFLVILPIVVFEYCLLMTLIFPGVILSKRLQVKNEAGDAMIMRYDQYLKFQLTETKKKLFSTIFQSSKEAQSSFRPYEEGKQISLASFSFLISLMLIIAIIQIVVGIDITLIFDFIIRKNKRYLPIVCAMYPNIMGAIKGVMEAINEKFELEFKYEIQFLQLLLAGLPYRLLYFEVSEWYIVLPVLFIKQCYKSFIYVIFPSNYVFLKSKRNEFVVKVKQTLSLKLKPEDTEKVVFDQQVKDTILYRFSILQFVDLISILNVILIVLIFNKLFPDNENFISKLSHKQIITLVILAVIEYSLDVLFTLIFIKTLSYTNNFRGVTLKNIIINLIIFLKDGIWYLSSMIAATCAVVFFYLANNFSTNE